MATLAPTSVIPALLFEIDDSVAAMVVDDEVVSPFGEPVFYGRNLSFDWSTLRFRVSPQGDPAIEEGPASLLEDVVKPLQTPPYEVPIYSSDYGAEFHELLGESVLLARGQVERIVRETLLDDPRVVGIEDFSTETLPGGVLLVSFSVRTFEGDLLRVPTVSVRVAT